jgi:hypothetical protein
LREIRLGSKDYWVVSLITRSEKSSAAIMDLRVDGVHCAPIVYLSFDIEAPKELS